MVAEVELAIGPVDILVNDARRGLAGPVATTDPDEWWQIMEVSLRGALYCSRAVLPGMLARGRGRIINISSSAGLHAWPMVSSHAVSKTALFRFMEKLDAETALLGVRAFAVIPGLVRTAMSEAALRCGEPSVEAGFREAFANGSDTPAEGQLSSSFASHQERPTAFPVAMSASTPEIDEMLARSAEIAEQDLYVLRPSAQAS